MFSLEANHRYFMCQHPVNMRKGIDSLFNLIPEMPNGAPSEAFWDLLPDRWKKNEQGA